MQRLLKKLYYKYCNLRSKRFTRDHPRYRAYEIGEWTYGFPEVYDWGEGSTLKIGKFCSISKNVEIYLGGEHRIDWASTYPFMEFFEDARSFTGHPRSKGDVVIKNDVWIANGVKILSGVTVENGAVLGAGSVVAHDVPAYAIVAGNPANILKYRFDKEIIEKLLSIQWWNWPLEEIKTAWPLIMSENVGSFLETYTKSADGK